MSLLLAELVGPEGEIVGIEQDPKSIGRARRRIDNSGKGNVSFREASVEAGVHDLPGTFDAVVGRFILMYLADPVGSPQDGQEQTPASRSGRLP